MTGNKKCLVLNVNDKWQADSGLVVYRYIGPERERGERRESLHDICNSVARAVVDSRQ